MTNRIELQDFVMRIGKLGETHFEKCKTTSVELARLFIDFPYKHFPFSIFPIQVFS